MAHIGRVVEAKAIAAALQPKPRVFQTVSAHLGMVGLQLRLAGNIKKAVVGVGMVAKAKPGRRWILAIGLSRQEAGMGAGDVIHQQAHPPGPGGGHQRVPIREGAQARLHRSGVNRVVAVMGGAGKDRRQPEAGHPESLEVVETADQPPRRAAQALRQIVGASKRHAWIRREAIHKHLINHRLPDPGRDRPPPRHQGIR